MADRPGRVVAVTGSVHRQQDLLHCVFNPLGIPDPPRNEAPASGARTATQGGIRLGSLRVGAVILCEG